MIVSPKKLVIVSNEFLEVVSTGFSTIQLPAMDKCFVKSKICIICDKFSMNIEHFLQGLSPCWKISSIWISTRIFPLIDAFHVQLKAVHIRQSMIC